MTYNKKFFTAEEKDYGLKILNSLRCGILSLDMDRRITAVNEIALRILDLEIRDYVGLHIRELFKDRQQLLSTLEDAYHVKNPPSRAEMVIKVSEGKYRTLGYTISFIKNEGEFVEGVSLFFKDLTLVEQVNEQEKLKDRLAALGQMAAGLAHEIRNPLDAIELTTSLVKRKLNGQSTQVAQLESIHSEVRKLNKIVSDCLEFVRPIKVSPEKIDLTTLLEESLESALSAGQKEKIQVMKDFLPTPPVPLDRHQMKQVFVNILLNAIQAITDSGIVLVACGPSSQFQKVGTYSNGGFVEKNISLQVNLAPYVWVRISDSGKGIPEEVLGKIFYPFFTTKEKGSGIGLSIAQKIIDMHQGSIDVESEVGRGTTFTIKLPVQI
jgi:signal transduction histidine kinase